MMSSQRTEHTVKNRFKSILSRQRKIHRTTNSEKALLKLLVNPSLPTKPKI